MTENRANYEYGDLNGLELRQLFLSNPEHGALKSNMNLKKLLRHQLFNSRETAQDLEILDHCVDCLKTEQTIDQKLKEEYYNKLMMEVDSKERNKNALSAPVHNKPILMTIERPIDTKQRAMRLIMTAKKFASAAAILMLCLLATELITEATGQGVFSYIINTLDKKFSIQFNDNITYIPASHDLTKPLDWLPDGFHLIDTDEIESSDYRIICYTYLNDKGEQLTYNVSLMYNSHSNMTSETNGPVDKIIINDDVYFTYNNYEINVVLWQYENVIYTLESKIDMDILFQTIKNNGE